MRTSLFISTTLFENNPLTLFCRENNWNLTAQSLIDFNPIPHEIQESFDVVFYSSKRCFNYFDSELKNDNSIAIATIGSETAQFLKDQNKFPDFIGSHSGSPAVVALEFKVWLGDRTVIFPSALHSNHSISQLIPEKQKCEVPVYETVFTSQEIEPVDWYVFTSPSNLNSFLLRNKLPKNAQVIAWGSTTEQACLHHGIKPVHTLIHSNLKSLVDYLNQTN